MTLEYNINNSKSFWSTIKSVNSKAITHNTITEDMWYNHFTQVLSVGEKRNEISTNDTLPFGPIVDRSEHIDVFNCEITRSEVVSAVKALKANKAPGPDGLISELYKNMPENGIEFLVKYFNRLFDTGTYPDLWVESVIQPIHKKGDVNSPNNYRGISLLNVCSKIYSHILNKRLNEWAETNNVISEAQAGFRRNYSTCDHIFTLMATIQKQLINHKKLYVAFIDFQKAFDMINRRVLWQILQKKWNKWKNVFSN